MSGLIWVGPNCLQVYQVGEGAWGVKVYCNNNEISRYDSHSDTFWSF